MYVYTRNLKEATGSIHSKILIDLSKFAQVYIAGIEERNCIRQATNFDISEDETFLVAASSADRDCNFVIIDVNTPKVLLLLFDNIVNSLNLENFVYRVDAFYNIYQQHNE